MSRPFIFLRENTPEVQQRLADEGFDICCCADFSGSIWLNGCLLGKDIHIHGVGYPDETDDYWNQPSDVVVERVLEDERECGNEIVDCGTDVDKFVTELRRLYI